MKSNNVKSIFKEMKDCTKKLNDLLDSLEPDEILSDVEDSDEAEFLIDEVSSYDIILIPGRDVESSTGVSPIKKFNGKWIQGIYSLDTSYEYPQWNLDSINVYNE